MTGGTYFSGGEGVGVAMRALGIEHAFGVEYDDAIANVARANGFDVLTANVCEIDPANLPSVDLFHASPVCKNASNAKADGKESPEDIATAQAVSRYIKHHKPRVFTLENVYGYRKFEAFAGILKILTRCGYKWDYWHLNSADYSVPQTRQRLILIAALDFQPTRPQATHAKNPPPMFDLLQKWVGWYEAIADLIPTLPLAYKKQGEPCSYDPDGVPCRQSPYCRGHFADWQLARLPKDLTQNLLVNSAFPASNGKKHYGEAGPSFAVDTLTLRHAGAFIADGKLGSYSTTMTTRESEERFFTLTTSHNQKDVKALLMAGGDAWTDRAFIMQVQGEGGDGIRTPNEPMQTLPSNHGANKYRAFLINESSTMELATCDAHGASQVASARNLNQRAWLTCGRVVKMTPRALARFQSFPDSYILPDKADLACKVIGNAVPPKLYGAVLRSIFKRLLGHN